MFFTILAVFKKFKINQLSYAFVCFFLKSCFQNPLHSKLCIQFNRFHKFCTRNVLKQVWRHTSLYLTEQSKVDHLGWILMRKKFNG